MIARPFSTIFLLLSLLALINCQLVRMPLKKGKNNKSNSKFRSLESKNPSIRINNLLNTQYSSTIQLGSNGVEFEVILDTGSSILWVPDVSLPDGYDCSRSSTCTLSSERHPIHYGSGNIEGYEAVDQVQLGDLNVSQFKMLLADVIEDMPNGNFHGILGLSLGRNIDEFPTLLEVLKESGQISTGTFSMYLGDDPLATGESTGEIIFGGHDPKYATGEFKFVEVYSPIISPHWTAEMTSIAYGTNESIADFPAIFDSGTSLLMLPVSFIDTIIDQAAEKGFNFVYDTELQLYVCSCAARDELEDLVFNFDGVTLTVPATSYLVTGNGRCFLGIQPLQEVSLYTPAVLGDILLRHYYTLYTADNSTVGFAPALPTKRFPGELIFVIVLTVGVIVGAYLYMRSRNGSESKPLNPFAGLKSKGVAIGSSHGNELSSNYRQNPYKTQEYTGTGETGGGVRVVPTYPSPSMESLDEGLNEPTHVNKERLLN